MHKIYEYEGERYVRLEDYEKSTKLLKAEIRNLKDDLDRIEEIKDREWIKLLNENERLSKELEKKEKSLRAWRKLKKKSEQEQISKWRIAYSIPNIIGIHGTEEIEGTVEDVYKFIYENNLEMLVNVITRVNNSYNFMK